MAIFAQNESKKKNRKTRVVRKESDLVNKRTRRSEGKRNCKKMRRSKRITRRSERKRESQEDRFEGNTGKQDGCGDIGYRYRYSI